MFRMSEQGAQRRSATELAIDDFIGKRYGKGQVIQIFFLYSSTLYTRCVLVSVCYVICQQELPMWRVCLELAVP
jgi:hypothetical protein